MDFEFYELLALNSLIMPDTISKFPKATRYIEEFEKIPAIKRYMASPQYIAKPITGLDGKWSKKVM